MQTAMRLTFLGTGGVWAAPVHGCHCSACTRARGEPHRQRRSASALIECDGLRILLDGGREDLPELFPPGKLDAVLLTHFHPDHVLGLFRLRWSKAETLPVFCPPDPAGCDDLRRHPGRLAFHDVEPIRAFDLGAVRITPLPLIHSRLTFGWLVEHRSGRLVYLTDTISLPDQTIAHLTPLEIDTLVLDCAFPPGAGAGRNHNDIDEAVVIARTLRPRRCLITHINHDLDGWLAENPPTELEVATDGEVLTVARATAPN